MHTVFVKLNILNILCFQATRQVKVARGKHTVHCTIHINSRGGKKTEKKKRKEKQEQRHVWNKKIQSKLAHKAQVHES